ncbi:unnamed protein product [Miscanthus lutarioriparius]|uniref:FBD domain-containing protein n=1 Tax=Miscanthus lutarioriparius TaxID=422564 RepID=A0A811Q300_9POAL|nr:unnamed protein product [Miscanthus lutarioriparius]
MVRRGGVGVEGWGIGGGGVGAATTRIGVDARRPCSEMMAPHQRPPRRAAARDPGPPWLRPRRRAHQRAVPPLAPRLGAPAGVSPRRAASGTVDAALGGYLAPTLEHLGVSHRTDQQGRDLRIPPGRIAPWLRFAAEHVVGELNLFLRVPQTFVGPEVVREEAVLELPLIVNFDVFIHSNSLHTLVLRVLETRRLEILAPRLEELTIIIKPMEADISAPKLVKVAWHDAYDPHLHRFVDVGRTLQLLETFSHASTLTKRFDEVDELDMLSCLPSCPCRLEESRKIDVIDLSSLEEVETSGFSGSHEQMELVEFLSSNARIQKRLLINDEYCRRPKEVHEKDVRWMEHRSVCRTESSCGSLGTGSSTALIPTLITYKSSGIYLYYSYMNWRQKCFLPVPRLRGEWAIEQAVKVFSPSAQRMIWQ